MAAVAGLRAIRTAGIEPDDIDLILLGTLTPDYWMPSTAALRQGSDRQLEGCRLRRGGGVLRVRLRVRHGPGLHPRRAGEARPRHRRGAAHPLPRLHGPEHLHPVRRRGGAVVLSASEEPGGALGVEDDDGAAWRLHDLAAGRRAKSPSSAETIARGEHYIRMEGKETYRFATKNARLVPPSSPFASPDSTRPTSTCSSRTRRTSGSSRPSPRAGPADGQDVRQPRQVREHVGRIRADRPGRAVNEDRVKVGDNVVIVAFGAGFTSGAVTINWTADPARGRAGDAAVRPEDVSVRVARRLGLGRPDPGRARGADGPARWGRRAGRRRPRRTGTRSSAGWLKPRRTPDRANPRPHLESE